MKKLGRSAGALAQGNGDIPVRSKPRVQSGHPYLPGWSTFGQECPRSGGKLWRSFRFVLQIVLSLSVAISLNAPALLAAVVEAVEQAEPGALPPGVTLPPGIELPPGVKTRDASKTNSAASPEEKRFQELMKLQFDRRAPAILDALAKEAGPNSNATNEVQRFQTDVVAGNWPAVKVFLSKLPEKQAPEVYKHLLEALDKAPSSGGGPAGPEMQMPNQPGNRPPPAPVLLPEDVVALAELAPGDLNDEQVELLGKLLGKALSRGNFIEPFLAKLDSGAERLGGREPKKRELTVKLLIAANRLADAGRFLPPMEEAIEKKEIKSLELNARYLIAVGKQETNSVDSFLKAWDLSQMILSATNALPKEREQALGYAVELLPLVRKDSGTNWLRETFQQKPEQGAILLSALGTQVAQSASNRDAGARCKALEMQQKVVDALLEAAVDKTSSWQPALNVLAIGWMQEADYSKGRTGPRRSSMYPQFDQFGNQIFYDGGYPYPGGYQDPNQIPAIPLDQLLPTAPSDAWLTLLDKSLAPRLRLLLAELEIKNEEEDKAIPYLEIVAPEQPKAALAVANELLRGWARSHDPNPPLPMNRFGPYGPVWYGPGSPYGMAGQGTPLTRAMQVRNIAELSRLLQRLHKLPVPPLENKALVNAFSSAHSRAEVFKVEDIETVFGPVVQMKAETLSELLQTMRERLAGQWRAPQVQQDAKTKRSDKEVEAEVTRGYELVFGLIQKGLERLPEDWRMNLVNGAALFDWAEFDYGRKVDLAIYVEKRDRAFAAFEKAAALYATRAPALEENEPTPLVFQQWFNATLGASDLAYITRQTEPNTNHLEKIRAALFGLPAEVVERHVAAFGKGLTDSINTLKPELKPRYLRAGVRIVGEHPSAAEARKLAAYYDDLLEEITLDVRVDGDSKVGHGSAFGVFVALRHTEALGRESGGFAKYLQNQQNTGYYFNPYSSGAVNYRENFEKQVREKFGKGFEVLAVIFHEDKVQARGYGRTGWRETPYAYLLLKAKDGSVDRIPPLQLDLDFLDRHGQVVLPVASLVQLIDARPESVSARPIRKIEVLQILDERDLAKGVLSLEVKATGRGLLPELKEALELNLPGFTVEKIDDKGLAISKMDAEGDEVAPVSERNWLLSLAVGPATGAESTFKFPKARIEGMQLTYKRYADADLVEVKPELALAGLPLGPRKFWHWIWLGTALVVMGSAGFWWWRKQMADATIVAPAAYALPAHITPFTVINLLQRMGADEKLSFDAAQRRELSEATAALQQYFFSNPATERNGRPNLEQVARHWVSRAMGARTFQSAAMSEGAT